MRFRSRELEIGVERDRCPFVRRMPAELEGYAVTLLDDRVCGNPTTVRLADQRRETGVRVETWCTQPLDVRISRDERACAQVADEAVIFDF